MSDVQATLRLKVEENVTASLKNASQQLQNFEQSAGKGKSALTELAGGFGLATLGIAGTAAAFAAFAKQSVNAAVALEGVERHAQAVYGRDFPKMQQAAAGLAEQFRRSESDILGYEAGFGDFLSQLGAAPATTEKMSTALAEMTVQYGKLYSNLSDQQIYQDLQYALAGNYRGLKELDAIVKDDTLQQLANRLQIKNKVKDMDDEQKATLVTLYLQDQLTKKQSVLADATGKVGDNSKSAGAAWHDLQEEFGKDVSPIVAAALDTITSALGRMREDLHNAGQAWADFSGFITGGILADPLLNLLGGSKKTASGPFGPAKPTAILAREKDVQATLNRKPHPATGGGGGENKAEADALSRAKDLLSSIDAIQKDIAESVGKQADDNKKYRQGLLDDLKIKRDMGTATKGELRDLETLDRRLKDGRDRVTEAKSAWEDQRKVVKDLQKDVDDLNKKIQEGADKLKDDLAKIDRDATRGKGQKIADLLQEQKGLNDKLAQGAGLSVEEQNRLREVTDELNGAKSGAGDNAQKIADLGGQKARIVSNEGGDDRKLSDAAKKRIAELDAQIAALQSNPDAYSQGQALFQASDLGKIDIGTDQKKRDAVTDYNKTLNQQMIDLADANSRLYDGQKHLADLQGDLGKAMGDYEKTMDTTYKATENATKLHVASQVEELAKEQAAVDALASSYSKVSGFIAEQKDPTTGVNINKRASGGPASGLTLVGEAGPELLNLPGGSYVHSNRDSQKMLGGQTLVVNFTGTIQVNNGQDPVEVGKALARGIQLQTQGSLPSP
jgi:hypothetical protein